MGITLDDIYFLGVVIGCVLCFSAGYKAGITR